VIADKLVSDPDLLTTTSATVPPRHRSMRSVIEASWRLLDAGQQRALARLSVFRGGFDPAAAEAVAGADPAMLSALVERSLVDRADGGHYGLHELLRQFATERLEAAGDAAATRRAHAGHYAGFLAARHDRLADALDTAVLAEVDPETANLRAAWQELAETGGIDAVAGLLEDLWLVHRRHGRFQEALGMLQRALAGDDATPRQRARWHLWAGLAQYQLGRAEEGQEELRAMLGLAGRPLPATGAGWAAAVARGAAGQARSRTLGTRPAADPDARQAAAEVAQAYAMIGETYYMAGQLLPMVASGVSTINAAERAGSVGDVAAGYAVTAISARVAGRHRLAGWYGRLANDAIATGTDEIALAYPLEVRGVDHITVGAWAAAEACLGRAAGSFARMGQPRFWEECISLVAVADCYRAATAGRSTASPRWRRRPGAATTSCRCTGAWPGRPRPACGWSGTPGRRWSCWRRPGPCSVACRRWSGCAPTPGSPWSTCGPAATPRPGRPSGPGCARPPGPGCPGCGSGRASPCWPRSPLPCGSAATTRPSRPAPATGCGRSPPAAR
jgi:tetratricopeptide (TPR) repeat protein